jgi:predicted ferric reductase
MNLPQWYTISLAAVAVFLFLYRIGSIGSTFLISRFEVLTLRHLVYPLLVRRRYWAGVTRLQGLLVAGYLGINGFCMGLGVKTTSDLVSRAGLMAAVNVIPLFLGGRTNMLANFIGISIHSYYLAHHWIGRVVIIQSLLHVGLAIAAGQPWTFSTSQVSGISVSILENEESSLTLFQAASALSLILVTSIFFVRRLMYEVFLKVHFLLAFIVVIALLEHVFHLGLARSMFPIIALSLWCLNAMIRWGRIIYGNVGGTGFSPAQASVNHFYDTSKMSSITAVRLTVLLKRPMKILPGQYVYLFLSDMGARRRFQAHPFVIAWWDNSMEATKISILIEPQNGLSAELAARNMIRSVVVDGPYGKDLRLQDFENVILVAKGIGIAGIIPYVRSLTYRRVSKGKEHESYRRGLITRKIDLYWVLEDNCQEDWVSDWLVDLRMRDSEKVIFPRNIQYILLANVTL